MKSIVYKSDIDNFCVMLIDEKCNFIIDTELTEKDANDISNRINKMIERFEIITYNKALFDVSDKFAKSKEDEDRFLSLLEWEDGIK